MTQHQESKQTTMETIRITLTRRTTTKQHNKHTGKTNNTYKKKRDHAKQMRNERTKRLERTTKTKQNGKIRLTPNTIPENKIDNNNINT